MGWGEAWVNFPPWAIDTQIGILHTLLPEVVGQPLSITISRDLYRRFATRAIQGGSIGPFLQALSAIDLAVWDLKARQASVALCDLLATAVGTHLEGERGVAVYASGIGPGHVEERVERAQSSGHTAFKVKVGFDDDIDSATVRAARRAGLAGARSMVDANQAWSLDVAATKCRQYDSEGIYWVEEPIPAWDFRGYQRLTEITPVVAAGENWYMEQHIEIVKTPLKAFQPDLGKCGVIWEFRRWGPLLLETGVPVALHVMGGTLSHAVALQVARAYPTLICLVEMDSNEDRFTSAFSRPWNIVDGHAFFHPSDKASNGLGVEIDEERLARWRVRTTA